MSDYEYKYLTPAEIAKLRRIFAADPRFRRRKKAKKKVAVKTDPTVPATDETTPTK